MATVTLIVGLCGSGKSKLAEDLGTTTSVEVLDEQFPDDFAKQARLFSLLCQDKDCVYTHIGLCRPDYRESFTASIRAQFPSTVFKWICFKNDLQRCNANLLGRSKGDPEGHAAINLQFWQYYTYPDDADIREVWNKP